MSLVVAPKLSRRLCRRSPRGRRSRSAVAPQPSEVDCIIVGAGAAGIAAARRLRSRRAELHPGRGVEPRSAGAAIAENTELRRAVRSRRALHLQPGQQSAGQAGGAAPASTSIRRRPAQRIRIGRRNARDSELEDFLAATVRANRAIADAARSRAISIAPARCRRTSANGSPLWSSRSAPTTAPRISTRFRRRI